jgi:hypothetical protein
MIFCTQLWIERSFSLAVAESASIEMLHWFILSICSFITTSEDFSYESARLHSMMTAIGPILSGWTTATPTRPAHTMSYTIFKTKG